MQRAPLALIAAALLGACDPGPSEIGPAVFVGAYDLTIDRDWFGGFSGFDTDDGQSFAMISDRGFVVTGELARTDGRITGIRRGRAIRTLEPPPGGWPEIDGKRALIDTEGLVLAGSDLFVSFEVIHAVWRYPLAGGAPTPLPRHPDFEALRENASLEALAIDDQGRLLTLPERPARWGGGFPVWRFDGETWSRAGTVPDRARFRVVGADLGPDGRLYVLERRLLLFGFASRIRSFAPGPDGWGDDERVVLQTEPGRHGNIEGLAVWQGRDGRIRLTMATDDNHKWFQRNELVEYVLPLPLENATPES